jgi:hypothetical protein
MKTDFTAEKQMKEQADRIQGRLPYNNYCIDEAKTKSLAEIVQNIDEKKFVTQDFDRFDRNYVEKSF